jgi:NAD(P)-dependent dehydrogenase (short-subunit alcohol dehydrogenase family)
VTAAGGQGVAVAVDHKDDAQVKALFDRVRAEQGRLDILVNNVTDIHDSLIEPGGFWERPLGLVDILDVGLRSGYVASFYAAPLLIETGGGLIAFTSSFGSVCYMHGPAYGDVAAISIWMGPLATERSARSLAARPDQYNEFMANAETPEFTGRLIAAVHADPERMSLSGSTQVGAELAERYGLTEEGGRKPPSYREMLGEPRIPHPAIVR